MFLPAGNRRLKESKVGPRFKKQYALGAAALATAALAGGAYAATQSGSNPRQAFINDVAKRLNVSPDRLTAALKAAMIDRINQAVKDGRITQAQANAIEQRINSGQGPMFFGPRPGFGLHRGLRHGALKAAASYLGLTHKQLVDQLRSGKSLADVAKAQGKSTSGLEQAMTAAVKSRLDKAVSSGRITAQQEQLILQRLQSRLDELVNRVPPRFGDLRGGPPPGGPPGPPYQVGPPPDGPPPGA